MHNSLCGQKRSFHEYSNLSSTTPGCETTADGLYDRQISEAERMHMQPYIDQWIAMEFKHGIDDSKLVRRAKFSSELLSKVRCMKCRKIVSDTAVQCLNHKFACLMCEECSRHKPSDSSDEEAILVPLCDSREINDDFAELKQLEFKCVFSTKCKHSIKYEELYKLGPYKDRAKMEHFCEYLPLRCLRCERVTSDMDKLKHHHEQCTYRNSDSKLKIKQIKRDDLDDRPTAQPAPAFQHQLTYCMSCDDRCLRSSEEVQLCTKCAVSVATEKLRLENEKLRSRLQWHEDIQLSQEESPQHNVSAAEGQASEHRRDSESSEHERSAFDMIQNELEEEKDGSHVPQNEASAEKAVIFSAKNSSDF